MSFKSIAAFVSFVALLYFLFVILSGLGFNPSGARWNFSVVGQLGDSFGPLNTFMAGLAAVGALGAYFAQKEDLREAKANAKADRKIIVKRDFEATYFNLIGLFRDTTNDIEVLDQFNQNPVRGRDAIKRIVEEQIGGTRGNDTSDERKFKEVYISKSLIQNYLV